MPIYFYATGIYTGFEGDPKPGVQQMVNAKNVTAAQVHVWNVAAAIDRMAARAASRPPTS